MHLSGVGVTLLTAKHGGSVGVLAQLANGDHAAFTRLVEAHDADMARLSFVICGDVDLARDATQNAWQRLWRSPPRLRDESRLRSWLLSVAANEARQLARRRRRGAVLERATIGPQPGQPSDLAIERADLAQLLSILSPADRELLGLRYLMGLSSREIATHLRLTPAGVRTRLHRLLARLRTELNR